VNEDSVLWAARAAGVAVTRRRRVRTVAVTASAPKATYVLGVSNTLVGNGWREEMICAVKAQATASGVVSKVIVANRNGGPASRSRTSAT
jgi:ABC-type sugar transport system substrate-binding protein